MEFRSQLLDPRGTPRGSIIRPDEVRVMNTVGASRPDRFFYVLYHDTVFEWDGYRVGPSAAPDGAAEVDWSILLVCPKCGRNLKLDSILKHLGVESGQSGLESEPIQCSYKAEFGGLCPWRIVLERPGRSDQVVSVMGRKVKIDAVARDAR